MLTDYTTPAIVRALLGVSDLELPDATVTMPPSDLAIADAMELLGANAQTVFDTVSAIPENSRSVLQARYFNQVSVYAATAAALSLVLSLRLAAPVRLTDGDAEFQRIANPYDKLEENLSDTLAVLLDRAKLTLSQLDSASAAPSRTRLRTAVTAGLAFDPVTGA